MRELSPSFYERRRVVAQRDVRYPMADLEQAHGVFREALEHDILTEHLLQLIWQHQRIRRDALQTVEGWPVLVLHPGFWNRAAGPDFRGAILQIGAGPVLEGDVEVDLAPHSWRGHGHLSNPAYQKVILHVVWEASGRLETATPVLPLKAYLDSPLRELRRSLGRHPRLANGVAGQCSAPLKELAAPVLEELLRQAALIRLHAKASEFEAQARQIGWEQCLWEGLFGGLGYKQNVWPMRRLAELARGFGADASSSAVLSVQAQLFGLSGLLPSDVAGHRQTARRYVRQIWDIWWRQRERFAEVVLPKAIWKWNGVRPANHPQRRLALAAHWLSSGDFIAQLEGWFAAAHSDSELSESLVDLLQVHDDPFWNWHWTMSSVRLRVAQPLIGPQRATDLAMNVLLPWFWMRAVAGKNESFQAIAEHRYLAWPRGEDNSVLRLARQRLFGGRRIPFLKTAAAQQGLLQIVRDFCDQSNALCDDCQFPALVKDLGI